MREQERSLGERRRRREDKEGQGRCENEEEEGGEGRGNATRGVTRVTRPPLRSPVRPPTV